MKNDLSALFRRFLAIAGLATAGLTLTSLDTHRAGADEKPAAADVAESDPKAADSAEYVRITRTDRKLALSLDTSVVHMGNSKKYPEATVDLIGAIHLGEAAYYDKLNTMFADYDVLLFEAVMPEEALKKGWRPGGGRSGESGSHRRSLSDEQEWTEAKIGLSAIGALQLGMKEALGLEFQLSAVDYSPKNFVHADMTQEEFESSMEKRGESFSEMMLREMGKSVMNQDQHPLAQNLDVLMSLLTDDRLYRVRRIAATQLAKADEGEAFAGADGTSTIITERNIKALEVLQRELKAGRRKIGIFYGAGHLKDMEQRMVDDFGFQRNKLEWLTAWELRQESERPAAQTAVESSDAGNN
ncbi:MAG: hypothetical protein KDA85_20215 [Planctomycetaceae bacterium]|nr:hypothetical protein [Planctomycetaceae bacterium]